mmetsp:Transcript_9049/g.15297  ORF Transcript_9049/g.15297 Transcript_9049/m.15297 type:complete len:125 (+) Transcript_9049:278-652(+)|eukprot:CAMPEP_0168621474 /NCGR_PEP_ID=MMETSP0449_2-20121227/7711_1 /TAXON_ID=1082188 /ORGANISM="Strombidium rassoulzadegani, Strain ras09" /LENGTH=124 /DNA_ID=CAMNT_0008662591 /DNA_START=244 /DNA_END=618 /DNA_ORIENTATION=+
MNLYKRRDRSQAMILLIRTMLSFVFGGYAHCFAVMMVQNPLSSFASLSNFFNLPIFIMVDILIIFLGEKQTQAINQCIDEVLEGNKAIQRQVNDLAKRDGQGGGMEGAMFMLNMVDQVMKFGFM